MSNSLNLVSVSGLGCLWVKILAFHYEREQENRVRVAAEAISFFLVHKFPLRFSANLPPTELLIFSIYLSWSLLSNYAPVLVFWSPFFPFHYATSFAFHPIPFLPAVLCTSRYVRDGPWTGPSLIPLSTYLSIYLRPFFPSMHACMFAFLFPGRKEYSVSK